jgi:AbrB family looped-hinge helix DNA binding protein
MNAKLKLDAAGRVVIPKRLREELCLEPGDTLSLETEGERMVLRPERSGSAMRRENGIWVFRSGHSVSADDTARALETVRRARHRTVSGS